MEWISVKDRLPVNLENVLCYNPSMQQEDLRYEICFYDPDTKEWAGAPSYFLKGITHFCIPEPPKTI